MSAISSPMISVIIPCKNGEKYLEDLLISIKNQNADIEIILVDDGSNDNTGLIAKKFNCVVIRNEISKGPVVAKNQALKIAKGSYIIFCDSDDIMNPNTLNLFLDEFKKDSSLYAIQAKVQDFISDDISQEEKQKTIAKPQAYYGLFTCAILMKKDVFDIIGCFNESLKAGEIIEWQTKMIQNNLKIKKIDFISTKRRLHMTNFGKMQQNREFKDYASILRAKLRK